MTFLSRVRRIAVMVIAAGPLACGGGTGTSVDTGTPVVADTAQPSDTGPGPADGGQTPDAPPGVTDGGCAGTISYPYPGCGASAPRVCSTVQVLDACAAITFYCGCDGKTTVMGGCNWSNEPYLYAGACKLDGGTADGS